MTNKQHKYILMAFVESVIPRTIRQQAPELMTIDSVLGGYCTQLLKGKDRINIVGNVPLITKDEKQRFSSLISSAEGEAREDLVVYYRLLVLVESILFQYQLKI